MSHPFEKLFETALKKSTYEENLVTKEARKLLEKGYSEKEICIVLRKFEKSLINSEEEAMVRDAHEEVCTNEED